ncbi:ScbA/BarX family gamma-butyrolactone biosynthesis protein [Streptomyces sp. DSM 44917]|uniref:ScbA/BarX family gamma-butyrolactone biosynthesis protein n=1 Tax=Streptomyces boetiae TaxID=3075541 RepID=A0ABU2L550_9ACTN|nr:ScbA/BarX family gamma-butyrolactone biosynthesis protein [Streptomyces sp. DSM 44917]MDT0306694.1 ScbA/BarX family gamma-butyrolactone biosynthesis protein [Streptomyces sp. DSM 44917]
MTSAPSTRQDAPANANVNAPRAELGYSQTVDRLLVHRDALGEVFLTDLRSLDEKNYAAAAQLPRSHAYYGDHLLRPGHHDPLLILEAVRQAAIGGAHRFYGVPEDHKFILTHLRLHLAHPQRVAVGPTPFPMAMHVQIVNRKEREGRVTGLDYEVELSVGGQHIGWAETGLRFRSPTSYLTLRLSHRDGVALPSSATHPPLTAGTPVAPYLVGRSSPDNVVLVNASTRENLGRALLRVPMDHPSMFDHPQDHLPGMVIAEGARQLALFTALEVRGMSTSKVLATDVHVRFERFGELEDEAVLTSQAGDRVQLAPSDPGVYYTQGGLLELEDEKPGAPLEQVPVRVTAKQNDQVLCVFDFTLTRITAP